jgi:hypothetical protein
MTVRFLEAAEVELDEAMNWYSVQLPSLGYAFLTEVLAALDQVARYREAWRPIGEGVRRCRAGRFGHELIYAIDKDDIVVLALARSRQRPVGWRDLLEWRDRTQRWPSPTRPATGA